MEEVIVKSFEKTASKVTYTIQIKLETFSNEIEVRYSKLLGIHEKFLKDNSGKGCPSFPPKKLFGNRKIKFLSERLR